MIKISKLYKYYSRCMQCILYEDLHSNWIRILHLTQGIAGVSYEPTTCFSLLDLPTVMYPQTKRFLFSWLHCSGSQQQFYKDIIHSSLFVSLSLHIYKLLSSIQTCLFFILLTLRYYTLSHSTTPVSQVKNSCTILVQFSDPIRTLLYFVTYISL